MEANLQREVRNSDLVIEKSKRIFLTYPADGLVPCSLRETEDGVVFQFDSAGLVPGEEILAQSKEDQYRFLINCAALLPLFAEYSFSLSPDNLLLDINLRPQVLVRDVAGASPPFLEQYKAIIGCVLQTRYAFEDYLNGGKGLYKKQKLLAALAVMDSIEEIEARLWKEYRRIVQENRQTKRLVSKRGLLVTRIAIPVLSVCFAAALAFGVYSLFWLLPQESLVLKASTAYIHGEYLEAQEALENVGVEMMNDDTKYVLARAYVLTEAMSSTQKENVLAGLVRKTDAAVFDYWIALGRLDFSGAIDLAGRMQDDDMLLFAYMKNEVYVKSDTAISGDEKNAKLKELDSKINELNKGREEALQAVNGTGGQ